MNEVDESSSIVCDNEEAVCYLCLDGGVDDDVGQPLQRDCACRGSDAGFVHLKCLAGFAASKSMRTNDLNEFSEPWRVCPSCHNNYQNELRVDLATKFISFVRGKYPHNTQMRVECLYLKLVALYSMRDRLIPMQKREAGVTESVILSLIDQAKTDISPPLMFRYSQFEAVAYSFLGCIALSEYTQESARRAVVHFENQLEVSEAIGDAEGIATVKSDIAHAKSMFEGGNNDEERLKASQDLYKLRVIKHGEKHEYAILAGKTYAANLLKFNRGEEARELLTKLLATSKQVLGPHHNTTKRVASCIQCLNRSM